MRLTRDAGTIKKLRTKIANLSAALILTANSIAVATPLFFAQTATAAPTTAYTSVPFTSLGLTTDRSAPSGGDTISPNNLQLNVDSTKANTSAHFYQTEGLGSQHFAQVNSVEATLSVPSA